MWVTENVDLTFVCFKENSLVNIRGWDLLEINKFDVLSYLVYVFVAVSNGHTQQQG